MEPELGEYEKLLVGMKTTARKELVLLHSERNVLPGTTRPWLKVSLVIVLVGMRADEGVVESSLGARSSSRRDGRCSSSSPPSQRIRRSSRRRLPQHCQVSLRPLCIVSSLMTSADESRSKLASTRTVIRERTLNDRLP
jgi:hypothetical protein